eukprot:5352294-Ditylum_brightwellii.AAC.1
MVVHSVVLMKAPLCKHDEIINIDIDTGKEAMNVHGQERGANVLQFCVGSRRGETLCQFVFLGRREE